uniref:Uncharacterized protein n=1 Tax=Panagrolaimus superbus TaxID=310955 RepID=A0A914YVE0_9BILA
MILRQLGIAPYDLHPKLYGGGKTGQKVAEKMKSLFGKKKKKGGGAEDEDDNECVTEWVDPSELDMNRLHHFINNPQCATNELVEACKGQLNRYKIQNDRLATIMEQTFSGKKKGSSFREFDTSSGTPAKKMCPSVSNIREPLAPCCSSSREKSKKKLNFKITEELIKKECRKDWLFSGAVVKIRRSNAPYFSTDMVLEMFKSNASVYWMNSVLDVYDDIPKYGCKLVSIQEILELNPVACNECMEFDGSAMENLEGFQKELYYHVSEHENHIIQDFDKTAESIEQMAISKL